MNRRCYIKGKKAKIIFMYCINCRKEFSFKDTIRNKNRKYCSSACAKHSNGKLNKGKKRTEEFKNRLSKMYKGKNNPFYGKHHTEKTKEILRNRNTYLYGKDHPNWKGGIKSRPDGYLRDSKTDKFIHRIVMEKYLGRKLKRNEVIHHINGNVKDNKIKNLQLMTNSEHRKLHCKNVKRNAKGMFA